MARWNSQHIVSERSQFDSRQFFFFSYVYQKINKPQIKTQEQLLTIIIVFFGAHHIYL